MWGSRAGLEDLDQNVIEDIALIRAELTTTPQELLKKVQLGHAAAQAKHTVAQHAASAAASKPGTAILKGSWAKAAGLSSSSQPPPATSITPHTTSTSSASSASSTHWPQPTAAKATASPAYPGTKNAATSSAAPVVPGGSWARIMGATGGVKPAIQPGGVSSGPGSDVQSASQTQSQPWSGASSQVSAAGSSPAPSVVGSTPSAALPGSWGQAAGAGSALKGGAGGKLPGSWAKGVSAPQSRNPPPSSQGADGSQSHWPALSTAPTAAATSTSGPSPAALSRAPSARSTPAPSTTSHRTGPAAPLHHSNSVPADTSSSSSASRSLIHDLSVSSGRPPPANPWGFDDEEEVDDDDRNMRNALRAMLPRPRGQGLTVKQAAAKFRVQQSLLRLRYEQHLDTADIDEGSDDDDYSDDDYY